MSTDIEVLLHKLINPSIEHRISAKEAMKDPYWNDVPILKPGLFPSSFLYLVGADHWSSPVHRENVNPEGSS